MNAKDKVLTHIAELRQMFAIATNGLSLRGGDTTRLQILNKIDEIEDEALTSWREQKN